MVEATGSNQTAKARSTATAFSFNANTNVLNSANILVSGGNLTVNGTANLQQITETSVNNFNTALAPSSGTLTVDTSAATVVLGDLNASVTTWAFTNVSTTNSKATTVTLIIDGDTAQTYGDACSVNGSSITNGVKWAGGVAPSASNNYDIITFTIVRDSGGTINVFGSGTVNFS
jgi:surface antigen